MCMRHLRSAAIALVSMVVALPALATETTLPRHTEPGRLSVTIGAEYTSGDYGGTVDTDIWYFPLTFRYAPDRWLFRITVPCLIVHGPGDVLIIGGGGMGMGMSGGGMLTAGTSRTESGLGDIIGAMSYRLLGGADSRSSVDLTGKTYVGTADEDTGLGTGENDYAAQIDATQRAGAASLFGTLGYRVTGDPPDIDYKDVLYGTLGIESAFGPYAVGVALDAQEEYLPGVDGYAILNAYLRTQPDKGGRVTAYFLYGLSDAAPDLGMGLTYGWYY